MHMDPLMPLIVGAVFCILVIGLVMAKFRQPPIIGYILAGILLGPYGFALIQDQAVIARMGEFGVILLLFFVGMEVPLATLLRHWFVSGAGTLLQISLSVGLTWAIGTFLEWPLSRIVLLGFVISLSSTAVVLKYLELRGQLQTRLGANLVGILLMQDIAVVFMLIAMQFLKGQRPSSLELGLQGVGCILSLALIIYLARKQHVHLPCSQGLCGKGNKEYEVFMAMLLCFGLALASGLMGLSAGLGAFLAGLVVASAKETQWVHESLNPFRVVFLALFFVSVGTQIDLAFIAANIPALMLLVVALFVTNTFINAAILRFLRIPWHESLLAGALLSQIGEFSFVLAAVGHGSSIISEYTYHMTISTIVFSLILTPLWAMLVERTVTAGSLDNVAEEKA